MTSFADVNVNREPLLRNLIVSARSAGKKVKGYCEDVRSKNSRIRHGIGTVPRLLYMQPWKVYITEGEYLRIKFPILTTRNPHDYKEFGSFRDLGEDG